MCGGFGCTSVPYTLSLQASKVNDIKKDILLYTHPQPKYSFL